LLSVIIDDVAQYGHTTWTDYTAESRLVRLWLGPTRGIADGWLKAWQYTIISNVSLLLKRQLSAFTALYFHDAPTAVGYILPDCRNV